MYEYFEGIVTVITPSYIVVDVNGVGYKIYSPTPFAYQKGDKAKILLTIIALLSCATVA